MGITSIILGIIGVGLGGVIGYLIRKQQAQTQTNSAEALAEKRIVEAKNKEQEILLQAKEKAIKVIDDAKKDEEDRRKELRQLQQRMEQRENIFDQKLLDFENQKTKLQDKIEQIKSIKQKIEDKHIEITDKLVEIAGFSADEAKEVLFKRIEEEEQEALMNRVLKIEKEEDEVYQDKARELIINAMQRTASNHSQETTASSVVLPSDEMKGRIIGKEGRNIKTLEKLTGCELIIDETPEMILVSSFSPIRRRICTLALEKLIRDGRIQPAKIEEYVEEAKHELAIDIKKAGDEALHEMKIIGVDPKLTSIVGRLKYRTSYGQNVLQHCLEVGHVSGIIATELGMDSVLARRAGFFHDIGKAVDQETEGAHTQIGYTILKKFNVDEDTAQVALTHHETNAPLLLTKIVMTADAISASRIGARRDSYEQYVARLNQLEKTASSFPGIEKVYAIQAGREVRVFVTPDEIDDYAAYNLAKDIARKIEGELQYPGEIKVNVIREKRVIEYAR